MADCPPDDWQLGALCFDGFFRSMRNKDEYTLEEYMGECTKVWSFLQGKREDRTWVAVRGESRRLASSALGLLKKRLKLCWFEQMVQALREDQTESEQGGDEQMIQALDTAGPRNGSLSEPRPPQRVRENSVSMRPSQRPVPLSAPADDDHMDDQMRIRSSLVLSGGMRASEGVLDLPGDEGYDGLQDRDGDVEQDMERGVVDMFSWWNGKGRFKNAGRVWYRRLGDRWQCMFNGRALGTSKTEREAILCCEAANWKLFPEEERVRMQWRELRPAHLPILERVGIKDMQKLFLGDGRRGDNWRAWVWKNLDLPSDKLETRARMATGGRPLEDDRASRRLPTREPNGVGARAGSILEEDDWKEGYYYGEEREDGSEQMMGVGAEDGAGEDGAGDLSRALVPHQPPLLELLAAQLPPAAEFTPPGKRQSSDYPDSAGPPQKRIQVEHDVASGSGGERLVAKPVPGPEVVGPGATGDDATVAPEVPPVDLAAHFRTPVKPEPFQSAALMDLGASLVTKSTSAPHDDDGDFGGV